MHLLRVDRPGDVLEAELQLRLLHGHHAREGADLAPGEPGCSSEAHRPGWARQSASENLGGLCGEVAVLG